MAEKKHTLSKDERLSWKRYIDLLFAKGRSFVAFPWRVIFLPLDDDECLIPAKSSILISVAKKKFRHAVQRNHLKRLARESYRTRKHELVEMLENKNKKLLIAFIYIDGKIHPFADMEKAMDKTIRLLKDKLES